MGEALEVAKALVAPTMKLLDMVGGAIGTAYEPRRKRKMADATVYEINAIGEAMRNAADLPIVYNQDGVAINSEDFNRLMQRAGTRLVLQETVKQHNIESVVDNAYEILEKEEHCSDEPVEQGWINRFFDSVADVSNEDLQKLWGKVLAGEIKKPKSCSLRTLETLKNLSPSEANLFQQLFPYIISSGDDLSFVSVNKNLNDQFGISDGQCIELDACGLLKVIPFTSIDAPILPQETLRRFFTTNRLLAITNNISEMQKLLVKEIYLLTPAGNELFNLFKSTPNDEYFEEWVKTIHNSNKKLLFTVHEKVEGRNKEYMAEPLISLGE